MANPFESQVQGVRQSQASAGFSDPDQYRMDILRRYIAGEGGLKNQVKSYAGAYRPDTARSALNMYQARSNQRQGLINSIEAMPGEYENEINLMKNTADQAAESGVKNTRQNYNRRGLLYSGLRQGGEQTVKQNVASQLASGVAGATKDYQNLLDQRKAALQGIELQNRQEALNNANLAFENTQRNNVARMQSFQQFGEGLGYLGGAYAGGAFDKEAKLDNPKGFSTQRMSPDF